MKETTSVGSRTPGPQGLDQYGAKVFPETGGLGGGKGSLGHTGGLSTVTMGRFTFQQVLPALPSRGRQTCPPQICPLFSETVIRLGRECRWPGRWLSDSWSDSRSRCRRDRSSSWSCDAHSLAAGVAVSFRV